MLGGFGELTPKARGTFLRLKRLTWNSIEDNVVITKDGIENLTTVPKDPEELEKIVLAGRV